MPAERHVPLRRCVVCRTSLPKERLVRFVKGDDGTWQLDVRGRAVGRGTWICTECARAADSKRIARGFRGQPNAVIDQLRAHFDDTSPRSEPHQTTSDAHGHPSDEARSKHHPQSLNSGGNHG